MNDETDEGLLDGGAAPTLEALAALPEIGAQEASDAGAAPSAGTASATPGDIEAEDAGGAPTGPE